MVLQTNKFTINTDSRIHVQLGIVAIDGRDPDQLNNAFTLTMGKIVITNSQSDLTLTTLQKSITKIQYRPFVLTVQLSMPI